MTQEIAFNYIEKNHSQVISKPWQLSKANAGSVSWEVEEKICQRPSDFTMSRRSQLVYWQQEQMGWIGVWQSPNTKLIFFSITVLSFISTLILSRKGNLRQDRKIENVIVCVPMCLFVCLFYSFVQWWGKSTIHHNKNVSSGQKISAGNSIEYNRIYCRVIYLQEYRGGVDRWPSSSAQIILCSRPVFLLSLLISF